MIKLNNDEIKKDKKTSTKNKNTTEKDYVEDVKIDTSSDNTNINEPIFWNQQDNQNNHHKGVSTLVIIVLLMIIIGLLIVVIYLYRNKDMANHERIELKYTETSNTVKEGIYITDVSETVENVMPAIVAITSKNLVSNGYFGPNFFGKNQYSQGAGSGIIISKTDTEIMILTNNHVVEDAESLSVKFIDDKSVDAKVKGTSEKRDVAVISVKISDIKAETLQKIKIATLGDSDKLKVGNGVIAIGNALGYGQAVTTGVVSALNRSVTIDNYTNEMIQIDAAINGGNSGGALLNSSGEVVGINSAKYSSNSLSSEASIEGMGFAIPITNVKELIEQLMNGEEPNEGGTIGVEGYIITDEQSETYNMPVGFYISKIVTDSGADKAKLEIGNIIVGIEGKEVDDFSDISSVLNRKKKGDKITLKIKYVNGREYKEKDVSVTLS